MTTVVPLKRVAGINLRDLPESTDPDYEFRYIDIGAVGQGRLVSAPQTMCFAEAPSRARRLVTDTDTIVSSVRTYLRAVWPVEAPCDDLVVSTGFVVLSPHDALEPRFLAWLAQSDVFIEEVVARSTGVSYPAISPTQLGDVPVPVPPRTAQASVAQFLDAETSSIDSSVDARHRSLLALAIRRAAVIEAGVAGRLAPAARRGSPLAWIDTVPTHWREPMLKLVARLGSGHTPSRSHPEWWIPEECTIPWITTGEVSQMRSDRVEFITETRERISPVGLANSSAELRPPGTVVLCRTAASAGYSAIMGTDMATSQDFATWDCGPKLRPRYLLLCLRAMRPDLLGRLAMGSTHKTIYMPDIESIRIPLPPVEEQDAIVEEVHQRIAAIDRASDAIERQIVLLQEHRQALITAAVTGQLDVTRAVA